MAVKEKFKANFSKNPKAFTGMGLLIITAVGATIGALTGVIEPQTAINAVIQVFSFAVGA